MIGFALGERAGDDDGSCPADRLAMMKSDGRALMSPARVRSPRRSETTERAPLATSPQGRKRALGAVALVAALLSGAVPTTAPAAHAAGYPSWDEVEAARSSTAASAAASARIDSLLDDLQARANSAGEEAIIASSAAAQAADAEAASSARADSLTGALAEAGEQAAEGRDQLGRIAAQLYRSGAADMTRVFLAAEPEITGADESESLLRQLGTASRVSELAATLRESALAEQQMVSGLAADARAAQRERARLADTAEATRRAAERASAAADAEVDAQRAAAETLFAQLAVLRNSTAEIERAYRAGVAQDASYAEQKAAAEKAAADAAAGGSGSGGAGGGAGGGSTPPNPSIPEVPASGAIVDPVAARAYAAAAVSQRGWSTAQYDCLVKLWNRESRWRVDAHNRSSDAYGIPQAAPGSKMSSVGADWRTNAATQIEWGLGYISNRYNDPCGAWQHSEDHNWY